MQFWKVKPNKTENAFYQVFFFLKCSNAPTIPQMIEGVRQHAEILHMIKSTLFGFFPKKSELSQME